MLENVRVGPLFTLLFDAVSADIFLVELERLNDLDARLSDCLYLTNCTRSTFPVSSVLMRNFLSSFRIGGIISQNPLKTF